MRWVHDISGPDYCSNNRFAFGFSFDPALERAPYAAQDLAVIQYSRRDRTTLHRHTRARITTGSIEFPLLIHSYQGHFEPVLRRRVNNYIRASLTKT